jgi:hypothetical protein
MRGNAQRRVDQKGVVAGAVESFSRDFSALNPPAAGSGVRSFWSSRHKMNNQRAMIPIRKQAGATITISRTLFQRDDITLGG